MLTTLLVLSARVLQIPSDRVVFNEKPAMKAVEITAAGIEALKSGKYKMVSGTGVGGRSCETPAAHGAEVQRH